MSEYDMECLRVKEVDNNLVDGVSRMNPENIDLPRKEDNDWENVAMIEEYNEELSSGKEIENSWEVLARNEWYGYVVRYKLTGSVTGASEKES